MSKQNPQKELIDFLFLKTDKKYNVSDMILMWVGHIILAYLFALPLAILLSLFVDSPKHPLVVVISQVFVVGYSLWFLYLVRRKYKISTPNVWITITIGLAAIGGIFLGLIPPFYLLYKQSNKQ